VKNSFFTGKHKPLPTLLLAGDYTAGDYPATLEGAVQSGVRCAAVLTALL
jgi:monoamine oxidase